MNKSIIGVQSRQKAIKGMDYLANAVKSTIGCYGLNFLIEKGNRITNDGYTISREICTAIKEEFERRGAITIHEASAKTNDQVGDATSTAVALAQGIIKESIRYLPSEGSFASKKKPSEVIAQIKQEKEDIIKKLKKGIKKIETEKELINSAKVSVEDDELAQLIGKTQWELGEQGIILVEETAEYISSIEKVKGIRIDNGFGTSALINNQEKQTLEIDNCQVIMCNSVLQNLMPLEKIIDILVKQGKKKIAIIAKAYSGECIKICQQNCQSGIGIYPINAPYTAQRDVMKDLEAILGGKYFDTEDANLDEIGILDVGFASKIICHRNNAIIAGSNDDPMTQERIDKRVKVLKDSLKASLSEFEKKMIQERIAQLTTGCAILKVGSDTDVERKRKKDKCDDAVNAVRLALQGGTVKGGGLAFKEIADEMEEDSILKRPLCAVYEQIMSSAPEGYIIPEWVRDPYLVLISALNNACSVAGTFASLNGIICAENPHQCQCQKSLNEEEQ